MAYVPPALRKKAQVSAPDGTLGMTAEPAGSLKDLPPDAAPLKSIADLTFSQADIHSHYWAAQNDENGSPTNFFAGAPPSALNVSAQSVGKLKYIMLFRDANPCWHSHGIIFVKSKLHILPGGERFGEDLLPETTRTRPEQPGDTGNEKSDRIEQKETSTEKAVVSTNEAARENVLVKESQVGNEKQEHDEKGEQAEDIGKSGGGGPNESAQHADRPVGGYAEDSRAKGSSSRDSDTTHAPDIELPYCPDLSTYDIGPIAVFEQVARQYPP